MHSDEEKSKLDLMAGGFLSLLWKKNEKKKKKPMTIHMINI